MSQVARERLKATVNHARFDPTGAGGHYESYFQRGNHPERPLAFWIRYTVFSPKGRPEDAVGELWAVYFDGEAHDIAAAREEVPIHDTAFARDRFDVRVGAARLVPGYLEGAATGEHRTVAWDLTWSGGQEPLLDLPAGLYDRPFPKAKALVGVPLCAYTGTLEIDGDLTRVDGWTGSQNHNWGVRHTDHYAWGQVAGFDNAPDSFLELITARLRVGPLWTPFMTPLVLRHDGREYAMNSLAKSLRRASFDHTRWRFRAAGPEASVEGAIWARPRDFVGLTYRNPPGGTKTCINTKIAACELTVTFADGERRELSSRNRAAFEILTDEDVKGIALLA